MITTLLLTSLLLQTPQPASDLILPGGPLERTESIHHRFTLKVSIQYPPVHEDIDHPFRMPLIAHGPFSDLSETNFQVTLRAGRDERVLNATPLCTKPTALGATTLSVTLPSVQQWPLHVDVSGNVTSWSSQFDDAAALQIPWPKSWPAAVSGMLQPSALIESADSIITDTVTSLTQGQVKSVPPVQAAKLIIQDACRRFKVTEPRMLYSSSGQLRGILVQGAAAAAKAGEGTPADLACICVAMLRAAGLPARPVIGLGSGNRDTLDEFGVWAEVFMPDCGWIPFDPDMLRQQAIATLDPRQPWEYFGTMPQLQNRIPLAWEFASDEGRKAYDAWALWSWTRFLPTSDFPAPIQNGAINTPNGPYRLQPARPEPSSIRLERTSLSGQEIIGLFSPTGSPNCSK